MTCPHVYTHSDTDTNDNDNDSENDAALLPPGDTVRLTSTIKLHEFGMAPLTRGRRGLLGPNNRIHPDIWDKILSAGIPVSLRELVSLTASQMGLPSNSETLHQLLQCDWTLGWHVTGKDGSGCTRHYWGGGLTPQTTSNYLRGDWVEVTGTETCRGERTSRLARVICGVQIKNVRRIFGGPLIDSLNIWQNNTCKNGDYVVYLLVRYVMCTLHPQCIYSVYPHNVSHCTHSVTPPYMHNNSTV